MKERYTGRRFDDDDDCSFFFFSLIFCMIPTYDDTITGCLGDLGGYFFGYDILGQPEATFHTGQLLEIHIKGCLNPLNYISTNITSITGTISVIMEKRVNSLMI